MISTIRFVAVLTLLLLVVASCSKPLPAPDESTVTPGVPPTSTTVPSPEPTTTTTPTSTPPSSPVPVPAIPGIIKGEAHPALIELWVFVNQALEGDITPLTGWVSMSNFLEDRGGRVFLEIEQVEERPTLIRVQDLRRAIEGTGASIGPFFDEAAISQLSLEQRIHALNSRLICPVCPGETIDESNVQFAKQMRTVVEEKLAAGQSEREILQFFTGLYGGTVVAPPFQFEGFRLGASTYEGKLEVYGGIRLDAQTSQIFPTFEIATEAEQYLEPIIKELTHTDATLVSWFSMPLFRSDSLEGDSPTLVLRYDIPNKLDESQVLFAEIKGVLKDAGTNILEKTGLPHGGLFVELSDITLKSSHFDKGAVFFEPRYSPLGQSGSVSGPVDGTAITFHFGGVPALMSYVHGAERYWLIPPYPGNNDKRLYPPGPIQKWK